MSRYEEIKKKVAERQRTVDRAAGVVDHLEKELSEEFGLDTILEAKAMLIEIEYDLQINESKFNNDLAAFEEEWSLES